MKPFDFRTPRSGHNVGLRIDRRSPLTLDLLEQALTHADVFWDRPADDTIVTFWNSHEPEPSALLNAEAVGDATRALFWHCTSDTLICTTDEELITFTNTTSRGIQAVVNEWNGAEAWPCASLTLEGTLRASIRVPLFPGTDPAELALLATVMSRSIAAFYAHIDAQPWPTTG